MLGRYLRWNCVLSRRVSTTALNETRFKHWLSLAFMGTYAYCLGDDFTFFSLLILCVLTSLRFTDSLEAIVKNARRLKHLSVGCLEELGDHTTVLLPLLAEHQGATLEVLHVATVKEDPDSYGLIAMPVSDLHGLSRLRVSIYSGFLHLMENLENTEI